MPGDEVGPPEPGVVTGPVATLPHRSTGRRELPTVGPAPRRLVRAVRRHERALLAVTGLVLISLVWEVLARTGQLKTIIFSSPSLIFEATRQEAVSGELWRNSSLTLVEFLSGFVLGAAVGVVLGLIAGLSRRGGYVVRPWLNILYVTPELALVPILILTFGIGLPFKAFFAFLPAVFTVAINTYSGVQSTESRLLAVGRSFGAGRMRTIGTVILPGTLPFIFTGMWQASGRSLVGVVVAELIASNQGLGFVLSISGATFNSARLMMAVVVLALFGVILGAAFRRLAEQFDRWRP